MKEYAPTPEKFDIPCILTRFVEIIGMTFADVFSRNSDWDENDNDFIASDGSVQHSSSGSNNSDSSDALGWFH